jgi:hypothetical protein
MPMPESHASIARGAVIDGRGEFTLALQTGLVQAVRLKQREICLIDPDFESWPLDDTIVLEALNTWARLPQRRLLMVAHRYDALPRRFARFTAWRGTFAHVVDAHATDVEPSQVPTLLLAGAGSLMLADRLRWRGHALTDDKEIADWREVVDVLLQRSEPAFGANTLGL